MGMSSSPGATARPQLAHVSEEKVKLLLVDDDEDNLLALQAILEPLHENLLLAGSGTDALRLCLDNDFAAILLDVRMPGLDGFETAALIRQRKRSSQTPILFLTAYRSDEQLFRGYDLGAVDFLFKPIVPEILQSKVAVFVELNRRDLLLRRQTEAVADAEKKFRAVLEAAPDAMVITSADGTIMLANSSTDTLFNYPRERLIGINIRSLIPEWDFSYTEAQHGASGGVRLSAFRIDGAPFPANITASPFDSGEGQLVTTAIRDDTSKVRAEERIHRINAELEARVAERTQEITRSNEALRQFAWAASHDLQEPIRMIRSYSEWLDRSIGPKLTSGEMQKLAVVKENAARMETLLAGLRQYIQISESEEQGWTHIDCNVVVEKVLLNLEGPISESAAKITIGHLPSMLCVEILFSQLIQNLVNNAIKYRSAAPPEIRVTADRRGEAWLFSVQDNGIGIEEEYLRYVFGVFKRLHGHEYSGTGIGLAICKAAVDRLGGRIWVESRIDYGSTFFFELPIRNECAAQ